MAPMGAPNGGNARGMARCRQPVMHGSPYSTSLERRLATALMAGDQQHHAVAGACCPIEPSIDRLPGSIEAVAVQVEDHVGFDPPRGKAPVPAAVKRSLLKAFGRRGRGFDWPWLRMPPHRFDSRRLRHIGRRQI